MNPNQPKNNYTKLEIAVTPDQLDQTENAIYSVYEQVKKYQKAVNNISEKNKQGGASKLKSYYESLKQARDIIIKSALKSDIKKINDTILSLKEAGKNEEAGKYLNVAIFYEKVLHTLDHLIRNLEISSEILSKNWNNINVHRPETKVEENTDLENGKIDLVATTHITIKSKTREQDVGSVKVTFYKKDKEKKQAHCALLQYKNKDGKNHEFFIEDQDPTKVSSEIVKTLGTIDKKEVSLIAAEIPKSEEKNEKGSLNQNKTSFIPIIKSESLDSESRSDSDLVAQRRLVAQEREKISTDVIEKTQKEINNEEGWVNKADSVVKRGILDKSAEIAAEIYDEYKRFIMIAVDKDSKFMGMAHKKSYLQDKIIPLEKKQSLINKQITNILLKNLTSFIDDGISIKGYALLTAEGNSTKNSKAKKRWDQIKKDPALRFRVSVTSSFINEFINHDGGIAKQIHKIIEGKTPDQVAAKAKKRGGFDKLKEFLQNKSEIQKLLDLYEKRKKLEKEYDDLILGK